MATAYDRGAAFERRIMARFEREGYWCIRAAMSKGAADFVALDLVGPDKRPLMVQCKRTARAVAPEAWNRLLDLSRAAQAVPLIAVALLKNDRVTDSVLYRVTGHKTEETARTNATPWHVWDLMTKRERTLFARERTALAAPALAANGTGAVDGGLTAQELAGIDQGKYRCARSGCGHGDAVHGPFCFVSGCACADWLSERKLTDPTQREQWPDLPDAYGTTGHQPSCSQGCPTGCDTGCPNWV